MSPRSTRHRGSHDRGSHDRGAHDRPAIDRAARSRTARHRKPSPIASALRTPNRLAVGATALTLVLGGVLAARWAGETSPSGAPAASAFSTLGAYSGQGGRPVQRSKSARPASASASPAGASPAGPPAATPAPRKTLARPSGGATASRPASPAASPSASASASSPAPTPTQTPSASGYRDPFRDVSGLIPERIDQGVDFGGAGPVYALGNAVITNATASNYGWPGGGWITYRLTDGPAAGLTVFLAEDVTPNVQVGQHVSSATVIAHMFNGGDGIEFGWAMASGLTAESQTPEAGGISGNGPFPTAVGVNFENLLVSLGVPASFNRGAAASGSLPTQYPTTW